MSTVNPVEVIAEALAKHHAVGMGICNCGWSTETKLGHSWREKHEAHQASVIAALPGIAIVQLPKPRVEFEHSPEYWIAARDSKGCIRLNQGRGLHVADSEHTRKDVQGWLERAGSIYWGRVYESALVLIDSENHATEGILAAGGES